MKHTPGPWRCKIEKGNLKGEYKDKAVSFVIDSESRHLMAMGECYNTFSDDPDPFPEIKANAQLMSAAPQLLEALIDLTALYASSPGVDIHFIQKARAAIDKATRRNP